MAKGTVKWFNDAKGFGFIEPADGGADVFAHFSAVQMDGFRTLKQGSLVSYELTQGPKGDLAQNITPIDAHGRPLVQQAQAAEARALAATAESQATTG
jgi:cold shock protein